MQLKDTLTTIVTFLNTYIDFSEEKFLQTVMYSLLCWASWCFFPHCEFRYKLLSRFTNGDKGTACDFLAYYLIYIGTLRNYFFDQAVANNIKISYGVWEIPVQIICAVAMVFGLVLLIGSFYRLKLRNMYFGDHFGFLFKERIVSFPYNITENAQYAGTTFFYVGYSVACHSPAGIFLSLIINILYRVLNIVESGKLKEFYPDSVEENKVKSG